VARLNRENRAETLDSEALDRESAIDLLSAFANDNDYPAKVRMDAIKALRELEAWDKQTGNSHGVNFLAVIMEQIDGRGVLPSGAQSVQIGEFEGNTIVTPAIGGDFVQGEEPARATPTHPSHGSHPDPGAGGSFHSPPVHELTAKKDSSLVPEVEKESSE
jgi:hypothetical protein